MRKSLGPTSFLFRAWGLLSIALVPLITFPQNSSPGQSGAAAAPVSVPPPAPYSDWKAFLTAAIKLDGLSGDDLPPWHLKVTYKIFDDQGQPKDQGIFEEFQASPTKFKVTYTSPNFAQSTYGTDRADRAVFVSGAPGSSQPWPLLLLWGAFVSPLPHEKDIPNADFQEQEKETPGGRLSCLYAMTKATGAADFHPGAMAGYCFDAGRTDLRFALVPYAKNGTLMQRTRLTNFQGRSLPQDLQISREGKIVLTAHLESIEAAAKFDEATFNQPAGSRLYPTMMLPPGGIPGLPLVAGMEQMGQGLNSGTPNQPGGASNSKNIAIASGIAQRNLLTQTPPIYPPIAKAARVSGTVVLQATIGKDGLMESVRVVSGPPLLLQAALDAVRQWTYKPYLLNGEPVEVETTVNVVFAMPAPPPQAPTPQP